MPESREINCSFRCLEQGTVAEVRTELSGAPVSAVPCVCGVSGKKEEVFLISDELAETVSGRVTALQDQLDAVLVAATLRTELYECDLADLTKQLEAEVLSHLGRLEESGVVSHRTVHGMNHFGVVAGQTGEEIPAILARYLEDI